MIVVCGRAFLIPGAPAANRNAPILMACPTHKVATGGEMHCIVSYIASPDCTNPPIELMYMWIGSLELWNCRKRSWLTTAEVNSSVT